MPTVDWIFLAVLLLSLIVGAWRGLVFEVLSVLSWAVAFVLAQWFAPDVAAHLSMAGHEAKVHRVALHLLQLWRRHEPCNFGIARGRACPVEPQQCGHHAVAQVPRDMRRGEDAEGWDDLGTGDKGEGHAQKGGESKLDSHAPFAVSVQVFSVLQSDHG